MLVPESKNVISMDEARWRRLLPRVPRVRRPCSCPACQWDSQVLGLLEVLSDGDIPQSDGKV